jgi:hypothetical protein
VRCEAEAQAPGAYQALARRMQEVVELGAAEGEVGRRRRLFEGLVGEVEERLGDVRDAQQRRWARASFLAAYFNLFNTLEGDLKDFTKLQNELYFALLEVNNASTEHLSLLHVCYEAAKHRGEPGGKLLRFWFEQLKRAHTMRYGGVEIEQLGELLQHTHLVLRRSDGFYKCKYTFL